MIRIFHISDLHFEEPIKDSSYQSGTFLSEEDLEIDAKTKNISTLNLLYKISRVINEDDYLLITGDIVDGGIRIQYDIAIEALEKFLPNLLLVPGNHDYGWAGNIYDQKCAKDFDNYFLKKLGINDKFFGKLPVTKVLDDGGDTKVLAVGLNSNLKTDPITDFARGKIGYDQLKALDEIITDSKYENMTKIVYLHHRPQKCNWLLELIDSEDLMAVVHDRADLMAFGHSGGDMKDEDSDQAQDMCIIENDFGIRYFLNANSSCKLQKYFLITVDKGKIRVNVK